MNNRKENVMNRRVQIIIILFLSLFVTYQLCAQNSIKDFKRIKAQRIIQIKKDYYLLRIDISVPKFSLQLQKYLASEMFKSNDSLLASAVNGFISEHELTKELKDKAKIDTLDYELTCVSYKPSKFVSMFMRYPDIHSLVNVSDKVYEIRDCVKSFVYDLKRNKVLSYYDIFNSRYGNLLVPGNANPFIKLMSTSNGYSFELDDDYLSYGENTYVRLPLCQTKEYFTPEFQKIIDWNLVKYRADSLKLNGSSVKEMLETRNLQEKEYEDSLEKLRLKDLADEYNAYQKDDDPYTTIHLYMKDDECWVSGLNKNIYELSESDIQLLSSKSKLIMKEIAFMKKVLEHEKGARQMEKFYTIEELFAEIAKRIRHAKLATDTIYSETPKTGYMKTLNLVGDYVKKHLSHDHSTVLAEISFIIDEKGHLICPVVIKGKNIEVNKEIVKILRKFEKGSPFRLDGIPIMMRLSRIFSYKLQKSYSPRPLSVSSRRPRFR